MKITQITVSYGATQSLPEYSNVKPSLTLTATLDDNDDLHPIAVAAALWAEAKAAVHEQIDLALEADGQPAKYSTAPRYQVVRTVQRSGYSFDADLPALPHLVIVLPDDVKTDKRFTPAAVGYHTHGLRYMHAQRIAGEYAQRYGAQLVDCSSGDLTLLWLQMPPSEPDTLFD